MKTEIIKANTRKSTHLLKKHLKEVFGIDCKVASEKYSMGSSLRISYNLGPDHREIENIVGQLQYGHFNGMEDIYEYDHKSALVVDGYELERFKYVFVGQQISDELKYKGAQLMSDTMKFQGVPELESKEQIHASFGERYGSAWTWGEMFNQMFITRNFVTQDESKIVFRAVKYSEKDNGRIVFIYEVDGVEYNTEELQTVANPEKQQKPVFEKAEVIAGEVQIIDYSDRAIAVIGDTKPIKDKLKELGGKFNFRLSCGPGWIFPKTRLDAINLALK